MIDYWVSFATSLDPNDGRGNPRNCFYLIAVTRSLTTCVLGPNWAQYTPDNEVCFLFNICSNISLITLFHLMIKVLLQLNGGNTTLIPDNYRQQQIDFINSDPAVFHHRRDFKCNRSYEGN
jgi:hypothetical protein